ncbi:ABC transporter substrate-binding protein [Nocardiopsis sp. MG754419]|uniref:ABC transporter substrate-binding protein n=1 Tax=Nocardiopsis sp. MG754419 TaxID=2259865 RepID=UPI001BA934BE|nr:extracellular solute-binding protein [Nocardiopsis sp. MG754419]MBR8740645.1 sugar-binding protein [Nocardiopsis sp. MG754419]
MSRTPRISVLGSTVLTLALVATGCGSSGPGTAGDTLQIWALEDAAVNEIVERGIESYNTDAAVEAELVTFVNDAYKQRLQVALGSPNAPDVFFNWGGGNLAEYVDQGQVLDITAALDENPEFRDAFLPSVLDVAKVGDGYYGVPMIGMQPVVLFTNNAVLEASGLEAPQTFDDLLDAVEVLQEDGVTPIVLPGAQGWTQLMWLSYLVERTGGDTVFQAVVDGEEGAWEHPAMIEAMELCRELVDRGAFGTNFASVDYDGGGASALLANGDAAMFLMGSWDLAQQQENAPEFATGGDLGYVPFPTVEGGAGAEGAVVGNPSNYFSVNDDGRDPDTAVDFLVETLTSDAYVTHLIEAGQVPAVEGIEDQLADSEYADFAVFTHGMVSEAPSFTQSWDQALPPAAAESLLTNLQLLFLGDITPEEFAADMESHL